MKEALRKLQWCPHRRTTIAIVQPGPDAYVVGNAATDGPLQIEIGTCIGSTCSQWRWDFALVLDIVAPSQAATWVRGNDGQLWQVEPLPRPPGVDASWTWRPILGRWDRLIDFTPGERDGHCGLSGVAAYD